MEDSDLQSMFDEINTIATAQEQRFEAILKEILLQLNLEFTTILSGSQVRDLMVRQKCLCAVCGNNLSQTNMRVRRWENPDYTDNRITAQLQLIHSDCMLANRSDLDPKEILAYIRRTYGNFEDI